MLIKNPPVEITSSLFMLGTNEYPLFLFKGGREGTLFEGGTGAMGALVLQQMEKLGIRKDFIRQVVLTHAHPDHVMAVPIFRQAFPGVCVIASEAAAKTLTVEKAIGFFCQVDGALSSSLLKAGLITDAHRPQPFTEKQIAVDRIIKEGDAIAVDEGASFNVLQTPGHSECSLSFHDPRHAVLIISDATGYYLPEHNYWWPNYFADYGAYVKSMERLAGLAAAVLCLSHNGAIKGAEDVKAYFNSAINATKKYHERIIAEVKAGKQVRQIAEALGAEVYEKTQLLPLDFFQKNCGLLVKQSLRHEGMPT
jgi:glyoxylase-like metal-dependent hydrolase (beta-lactamase superfamily II)